MTTNNSGNSSKNFPNRQSLTPIEVPLQHGASNFDKLMGKPPQTSHQPTTGNSNESTNITLQILTDEIKSLHRLLSLARKWGLSSKGYNATVAMELAELIDKMNLTPPPDGLITNPKAFVDGTHQNLAILKGIAAATSIIIEELDGYADILPLMSALYLADKKTLDETGFSITGDNYMSMDHGPVLTQAYNLLNGFGMPDSQTKWDTAFERNGHTIYCKGEVDKGPLSPRNEEVLRHKAQRVKEKWEEGTETLIDWMRNCCPEWENPCGSPKPIPVSKILKHLPLWKDTDLTKVDKDYEYTNAIRNLSILNNKPLLLQQTAEQ
jgi:hypothetical protein